MNVLCEVEVENRRVTKASMDHARGCLEESLEYLVDKLLATLAEKHPSPGDIVGMSVGFEVKFGVVQRKEG